MKHTPSVPLLRIALAAAFAAAISACDQSHTPMLAGVESPPAGGSQNSGTPALRVFPDAAQITVGATVQLQTNAPIALQNRVQWRSSNPAIAVVTTSGTVTGFAPGSTTIQARYAFDTTNVALSAITVLGVGTAGTTGP